MIDEGRARMGIVKSWFNGDSGYGFILPEEGGEAVFVHHTCIAPRAKAKSLKKGARVSYEVTRKKMAGLWAKDVCIADYLAPKSATTGPESWLRWAPALFRC